MEEFRPRESENSREYYLRLSTANQELVADAVRDDPRVFSATADNASFAEAALQFPEQARLNAEQARSHCKSQVDSKACEQAFDDTARGLCQGENSCINVLPTAGSYARSQPGDTASTRTGQLLALTATAPSGVAIGAAMRASATNYSQ